jgi:TP901 family phage tail tape measure protein
MADADLLFRLKMQDDASSTMKGFGSSVRDVAGNVDAQIAALKELTAAISGQTSAVKTAISASKEHAEAVKGEGKAHKEAGEGAEEHEASIRSLISASHEAAEAFAAMWTASEIQEKTLGAWSELEVPLLRIQKATQAATADMNELQEAIEGLAANSLNQTNEQVAAIALSAAQLGLKGEGLAMFTKTVSELATVTGASTEQVSHGFSQILQATGETQEGAEKLGDAFAVLANKTKGGGAALLEVTSRMTQMTAGMHMSSETVLGISSAVQNLGLRGETASRAIGMTLSQIDNLSREGKQGLNNLAAATGMSAEKFAELEKEHPEKALLLFLQALHGLSAAGGDTSAFLKQFNLAGREIEVTLKAAANSADQFKTTLDTATGDNNGVLGKDNADYLKTLESLFHQAGMAAAGFGEDLGKAAAPEFKLALEGVVGVITGIRTAFAGLDPISKSLIATFVIAAPAVIAAGAAWKVLSEVVSTGLGVYRNMSGILGTAIRAVETLEVAEEMAGEKAMTSAAKHAEASKIVVAAKESEARAAGIAAVEMEIGADKAVVAEERIATTAEATASRVGLGWKTAASEVAKFALDVGALYEAGQLVWQAVDKSIGLFDAIQKMRQQGFSGRDVFNMVNPLQGQDDLIKSIQQQKDRGQIHLSKGGEGGEGGGEKASGEGKEGGQSADRKAESNTAESARAAATVWNTALKAVDDYNEKLKQLNELNEKAGSLSKVDEATLANLQTSREEVAIEQKLIELKIRALDPMNKMRDNWKDQLAAAQAVTKEEQNQVAIAKAVADAQRADPRFSAGDALEMASRMKQVDDANRDKSFTNETTQMRNQVAMAAALTNTERDRLAVKQQLAQLAKDDAFTPAQLAAAEKLLTAEKAITAQMAQWKQLNPQADAIINYGDQVKLLNKSLADGVINQAAYNREKTKLDNDTLQARDPIGKIVQDQKEELAQLAIVGQYRDADLKTLEEITTLQKQGIELSKSQADILKTSNRNIADVKQMQSQLDSLTSSFSSGLGGAIGSALNGQKYAFQKFFASLGQKMMDSAFDYLGKQIEGQLAPSITGLFGDKTKSGLDALTGVSKSQVADTTAGALSTAQMMVTATTVIINGAATGAGAGGAADAGANLVAPGAGGTSGNASPEAMVAGLRSLAAGGVGGAPAAILGALTKRGSVGVSAGSGAGGTGKPWVDDGKTISGIDAAAAARDAAALIKHPAVQAAAASVSTNKAGGVSAYGNLDAGGINVPTPNARPGRSPYGNLVDNPARPGGGAADGLNGDTLSYLQSHVSGNANTLTEHMMSTYGLTREQAVGAVGTMGYESGNFKQLQEMGHSGTGSGYGYAQWTGPRRTAFMENAQQNGLDPKSYDAQVSMIDKELGSAPYKRTIADLKNTDNPADASKVWQHDYEGMNVTGKGKIEGVPAVQEHIDRAQQYYNQGVGLPRNQGIDTSPNGQVTRIPPKIDSMPTGSIDAAKRLADQQKEMQAELTKNATEGTQNISQLSDGIGGLAGKAASAVPGVGAFSGVISSVVSSLTKGLGGGGGAGGPGAGGGACSVASGPR